MKYGELGSKKYYDEVDELGTENKRGNNGYGIISPIKLYQYLDDFTIEQIEGILESQEKSMVEKFYEILTGGIPKKGKKEEIIESILNYIDFKRLRNNIDNIHKRIVEELLDSMK